MIEKCSHNLWKTNTSLHFFTSSVDKKSAITLKKDALAFLALGDCHNSKTMIAERIDFIDLFPSLEN